MVAKGPARPAVLERELMAWDLANGESLRLRLLAHRGREYLDLRRFYRDGQGAWQPTPRGIRFNSELSGPLAEVLGRIAEGDFNDD